MTGVQTCALPISRGARLGDVDQLDMATMQITHRRHKYVIGLALQTLAQVFDRVDDVHGVLREERSVRCA